MNSEVSESLLGSAHQDIAADSNLTASQWLIWVGQKLYPDQPLYNMAMTFDIGGRLNTQRFVRAFQGLVDSSDAMRTVVEEVEGVPQQRIVSGRVWPLEFVDFSAGTDADQLLLSWVRERAQRLIQLDRCLFDSALIKMPGGRYVWYINQHHLITDGWSVTLVYKRLLAFYQNPGSASVEGYPQFSRFRQYEQAQRQSAALESSRAYWHEKLNAPRDALNFYGGGRSVNSVRTERINLTLDHQTSEKLRQLAMQPQFRALTLDMALFQLFATAMLVYVHRVTGAERLVMGAPAHNRSTAEHRNTLGLFVELFALHVDLQSDESFSSLHKKIGLEAQNMLRHAHPGLSTSEMLGSLPVVLNFIKSSFSEFDQLPMRSDWVHPNAGDPQHEMRLEIEDFDNSGEFILRFDFNADLFSPNQRQRAIEHFLAGLHAMMEAPEQRIDSYALVGEAERSWLMTQCGDARYSHPQAESIVERFEQQVQRRGSALALTADDRQLTYAELDLKVNQLAQYLIAQDIGKGDRVALCLNRSSHLIVGILGVLKSGASYLPLDPCVPPERLSFMLANSGSRMVVTESALVEKFACGNPPFLQLDADKDVLARQPRDSAGIRLSGDDQAYVIYTSGSTGEPKGAVVLQRNVLALVQGLAQRFYPAEGADQISVGLLAPYVFDASIQQIFGALLQGHCLHLIPDRVRTDGDSLLDYFSRCPMDLVDGTPAHLRLLNSAGRRNAKPLKVGRFLIGGEPLPTVEVQKFVKRYGSAVTNIYGVAECAVDSLAYDCDSGHQQDHASGFEVCADSSKPVGPDTTAAAEDRFLPLGRPLAQAQVNVLDPRGQLQPVGVAGEICIGGDGVGAGYLGADDLTASKFVKHPWLSNKVMFRTGDIGRIREDGNLEFLRRNDRQVNIRGYRIELEEVEHALRAFRRQETPSLLNTQTVDSELRRCVQCVVTSAHPDTDFDEQGLCSFCREYSGFESHANRYFGRPDEFSEILQKAQLASQADYDCMLLYSGGKDSSYVLHRLVEMGLKVLAFTFDNGFISPSAFDNIRRQTERLGVDSIVETTRSMDEILVESLKSDQTVCTGCFKSLTSISNRIAVDKGINVIVTGLSRGQIFDTKLAGLYREGITDVEQVEEKLLTFRQLFHANQDRTARLLDVDLGGVEFGHMYYLDYFRYDASATREIRDYLKQRDSYWSQPQDTGFCSSNCMVNDIGISVHTAERGFHNYEAPLSWDIRLGVCQREEALAEVHSEVDQRRVNAVLQQIGYFTREITGAVVLEQIGADGHAQLCAYFVANQRLGVSELRAHLTGRLPDYMIPAHFIQVEHIPLTLNGKVDRQKLPAMAGERSLLDEGYLPPVTKLERELGALWSEFLRVPKVGLRDNFFSLGGDSIIAIQIVGRANERNIRLKPSDLFEHQTIEELAGLDLAESEVLIEIPESDVEKFQFVDLGGDKMTKLQQMLGVN